RDHGSRQRDALRSCRAPVHERAHVAPPRRPGERRRPRLGQLAERARSPDAVRRHEAERHRPRGRSLQLRVLLRARDDPRRARRASDPAPRSGRGGPVNTDWGTPPFDIVRVAHVELVVTDLAVSREFYVDVLGLVPTEETSDAIYLRGFEERLHHSLVLRQGSEALVDHVAFRVGAPDDLDAIAAAYA